MEQRGCKHRDRETTRRLPHLLDIPKLAEHLGVTDRHVRRLVDERRVPYVRWGRRIRFDPDEVARWLEAARVEPLVDARGSSGSRFARCRRAGRRTVRRHCGLDPSSASHRPLGSPLP